MIAYPGTAATAALLVQHKIAVPSAASLMPKTITVIGNSSLQNWTSTQ
jgi:hypothetical protein